MKIILNPDEAIVASIRNRLKITNNFCPCVPENQWTADHKCPCKALREEKYCCCGLYLIDNNKNMEENLMSREQVKVHLELLSDEVKVPFYAHMTDAGMDVYAAKDMVISPQETIIVPTGLKMAIPEGYEIQVRPRSGLSYNTPLRVSNSPGTIDTGYRNEVGVIITNTSKGEIIDEYIFLDSKGNKHETYQIKKNDRIAQFVLAKVPMIVWNIVDDINSIGEDRGGGFGSTGVK